jgi:hypothetical protein
MQVLTPFNDKPSTLSIMINDSSSSLTFRNMQANAREKALLAGANIPRATSTYDNGPIEWTNPETGEVEMVDGNAVEWEEVRLPSARAGVSVAGVNRQTGAQGGLAPTLWG